MSLFNPLSPSLSLPPTISHSLTLTLSLSLSLSHTHSLSLYLSLSQRMLSCWQKKGDCYSKSKETIMTLTVNFKYYHYYRLAFLCIGDFLRFYSSWLSCYSFWFLVFLIFFRFYIFSFLPRYFKNKTDFRHLCCGAYFTHFLSS